MSAFKLVDGRCPDCGQPPATRGWVEEDDTRGDLCTHPCHDEEAPRVDWVLLVAGTVHPTKVLVLEAAEWIGEPVSAWQLGDVFEGAVKKGDVAYHLRGLAELGALEKVGQRQVRGALEKFWVVARRS
jgi:hypothetical protein